MSILRRRTHTEQAIWRGLGVGRDHGTLQEAQGNLERLFNRLYGG